MGGVFAAIENVMDGRVQNAFCAVRPPGHHAESNKALGFCFFNNIALGAKYLLENYGLERVAIIDWDVHHGNGTQAIFYETASVLYASIHQYPFYPGSGGAHEQGRGAGKGFNVNEPLAAGANDIVLNRRVCAVKV